VAIRPPLQRRRRSVELEAAEVREYEEDLSSVSDFRENSIKGPQFRTKKHTGWR
jgi:hypothetical protein